MTPWLRLDANSPWHDKVIGLPSDAARWAWIKCLSLAKQHGTEQFSRTTLVELLGKHGRFVPDLIASHLLDEDGTKVTVHDFEEYQRRAGNADRQARHRARNAESVTPPLRERDGALPTGQDRTGQDNDRTGQDAREAVLPDDNDGATLACRLLPDGGRWLTDREYVAAWDDLDRRFGEWVSEEMSKAYQSLLDGGRVRAWDLKRATEMRLAERNRAAELERERRQRQAEDEESERIAAARKVLTPEEKERSGLVRQAVRLWLNNPTGTPVPEKVDDLRQWIAERSA